MEYGLSKPYLGRIPFLSISSEEFEEIKRAQVNLLTTLAMEETINLLLENYEEYERELLNISLHRMIFLVDSWSLSMSEQHAINRRIVNLFTTCRLYLDRTPHDLNTMYGKNSAQATSFVQQTNKEHDTYLGYRVCEAIRNFVQHRGFPLYGLRHGTTFDRQSRDDDRSVVKYTITPYLKPDNLKEIGGFKSKVLKEIEILGDKVDVKPFIREYIDAIKRIHLYVRQIIVEDVRRWDEIVELALLQFASAFDDDMRDVVLVIRDDKHTHIESHSLFEDLISRRKWLENKNPLRNSFSAGVITSELHSSF